MKAMLGIYMGLVERNQDPEKLGRVKVRVPHVYGIAGGKGGYVTVDKLPWAIPAALPAGGSSASGGMDWLPEPGDQVLVQFLDGEPEKPVWMWSMQTRKQAKDFPLHSYENNEPQRGALTRYGNVLEFNDGSTILTTPAGYRSVYNNGNQNANDGFIQHTTPKGNLIEIADETDTLTVNINQDVQFNVNNQFLVTASDVAFDVTNGSFNVDVFDDFSATALNDVALSAANDMKLDAVSAFTLTALSLKADISTSVNITSGTSLTLESVATTQLAFAQLLLGNGASQPFVLGNVLETLFNTLVTYLAAHTHSNGNNGSPTGPPIVPPNAVLSPLIPTIKSSQIFGS